MKTWFGWAIASLVLVFATSYAWTHRQRIATPAAPLANTHSRYTEEEQAGEMVEVRGPLADQALHLKSSKLESSQPTPHPVSTPVSLMSDPDPTGESPVGTSKTLLRKTFPVTKLLDLPFDLPAHASSPQLRGTYRSFVSRDGLQQADSASSIEFLLLNDQQYSDLLNGRPADALFSAQGAPEQEINFSMPPTLSHPVKYHLLFRNSSPEQGKRLVQADFRVDF